LSFLLFLVSPTEYELLCSFFEISTSDSYVVLCFLPQFSSPRYTEEEEFEMAMMRDFLDGEEEDGGGDLGVLHEEEETGSEAAEVRVGEEAGEQENEAAQAVEQEWQEARAESIRALGRVHEILEDIARSRKLSMTLAIQRDDAEEDAAVKVAEAQGLAAEQARLQQKRATMER
jgi:hypothetical protein